MIEDEPIKPIQNKRIMDRNNSNSNDYVRSSTNTEPILYEHLRRLMNDISNYWADYKMARLGHALQDLYTLIRPRLKGKEEIIKDLEDKRDKAHKALTYKKEDVEKQGGFSYQDNLIILKRKLYSQAKPLLLDFQTALYEQLYELKLILGGDTK